MVEYINSGLHLSRKELSEKLPQLRENCMKLNDRFKVFLNRLKMQRATKVEMKSDASFDSCWYFKKLFRKKTQQTRWQKAVKYRLASEQVKEKRNSGKNASFLGLLRRLSPWKKQYEGEKDEAKELIALDLLGIRCGTE